MAKKITKWEPDDFELEMTTHWSFPKRGDWATHDANGVVIGRLIFLVISYFDIPKRETWCLTSLQAAAQPL